MKRKGVNLLCLVVFVAACGEEETTVAKGGDEPNRPNVIVVLADDMRANYTGFEGHPLVETPNIDMLATQGTFFSNAFATSAVCTPSRTSLLTGLYERRHGVNFNSRSALTEEAFQQTYPMILKDAGYFVGYIGKNHTPVGKNADGVIGYNSGVMDESFDYWYAGHRHLGFYPKDRKQHKIFANAKADTQVEILEEGMENFFTPDSAFQAGYDFLDGRPDDQPFALLLNFNVPHGSSTSSMELRDSDLALYRTAYRDGADKVTPPETYIAASDIVEPKLPLHVYNGETIPQYDYVKAPDTLRERQIRTLQTISGIDKLLGKLLEQLERQGVADNTIIVFTSDHGLLFGEFGMGGKVFVYDASAKIPLIIYDPRLNKDTKVDKSNELVALVDIAPTLLDLAGVSIPDEMQGRSVKPLMQGQETEWRQELFLENMMTIQNYPRIEAVRTHDWKYIRYFDRERDQAYSDMLVASINGEQPIYEELFDLENDPHETHNVIEVAANSEIVAELSHRTSELVEEYRGTLPANTHSDWELVFSDPGEGDWQEHWFVEGKKATVEYDEESLVFTSGPVPTEQASHAVLWTKQSFSGDIRIEYDYTRVDSMAEVPSVNILYIQTTGLGTDESPTDIYLSTEQREVPWMKSYFLNMNALHISYATTGPKRADYVAARRYPAKDGESFMDGTMIQPIYEGIHLFEPGETYHITATKEGDRLTFTAERDGKTHRFEWDTSAFPPVTEGRVGLRHMWARSSRYENIKVFQKYN